MRKTNIKPLTWRGELDYGQCMRPGCNEKAVNRVSLEYDALETTSRLNLLLCAECSLHDAVDLVYPKSAE